MRTLLSTRHVFLAVVFLGLFGMAIRDVTDPDVLGNAAGRSSSSEGSELPVEVWLPYLIDRVAQLAPELSESLASTAQGLEEAIAQAAASAAGPLGLTLETLQAQEVPLVDPGLVGLAGQCLHGLADRGQSDANAVLRRSTIRSKHASCVTLRIAFALKPKGPAFLQAPDFTAAKDLGARYSGQ